MGREPSAGTVKVAVRIVDGVPRPFYGTNWPKLKDGVIGELTLPRYAFLDATEVTPLTAPLRIPFIGRNETLFVAVNNPTDSRVVREADHFTSTTRATGFVPITTDQELYLDLRGTKRASLAACKCRIPTLNRDAESVNEAYRIISEAFEPDRRSFGGNVFLNVYYRAGVRGGKDLWAPLDVLRMQKEASLEARFRERNQSAEK